MGNCVGGFKRTRNIVWHRNRNTKSLVVAFLGLDFSGKTTIAKALQGEGAESVHPTMGFSRSEFTINKCRITAYDLGGAERIRDIWKIYYSEIYAIIYVVDCAALSRMDENKRVVETLRSHPDLMYKPILFLLNKKDLPGAMDEMTFSDNFNLHTMACENKTDIRVEGVCAAKGHGKDIDPMIVEGISWLIERVFSRYEQLNKEIETALKQLSERQAHERLQRQHRLANLANQNATEEIEPIPNSQNVTISNGSLPHTELSKIEEDVVERGVVETNIEYHAEASVSSIGDNRSLDNIKSVSIEYHAEPIMNISDSAQKKHTKRANNKVLPEANLEEAPKHKSVDYSVFENSLQNKQKRNPLRSKIFDSKTFFQPVHKPRLLSSNNSNDIEMTDTQNPNHIDGNESTNPEENWSIT